MTQTLTDAELHTLAALVEHGAYPTAWVTAGTETKLVRLGYAVRIVVQLDETAIAATPAGRAIYCDHYTARTATLAAAKRKEAMRGFTYEPTPVTVKAVPNEAITCSATNVLQFRRKG